MIPPNHTCAYANCRNKHHRGKKTGEHITFFKFPVSDLNRCQVWKDNSGNPNVAAMECDELKNKLICEKHFAVTDLIVNEKRKLLQKTAVPVKFVKPETKIYQEGSLLLTSAAPTSLQKPSVHELRTYSKARRSENGNNDDDTSKLFQVKCEPNPESSLEQGTRQEDETQFENSSVHELRTYSKGRHTSSENDNNDDDTIELLQIKCEPIPEGCLEQGTIKEEEETQFENSSVHELRTYGKGRRTSSENDNNDDDTIELHQIKCEPIPDGCLEQGTTQEEEETQFEKPSVHELRTYSKGRRTSSEKDNNDDDTIELLQIKCEPIPEDCLEQGTIQHFMIKMSSPERSPSVCSLTSNTCNDYNDQQRCNILTDKINSLQKKVKAQQSQLYRLKKKTSCSSDANVINDLLEDKSHFVKTFVRMQLYHTRRTQWSASEKQLALSLHSQSPRAYKHMLHLQFNLPSVRTVRAWLSGHNVSRDAIQEPSAN